MHLNKDNPRRLSCGSIIRSNLVNTEVTMRWNFLKCTTKSFYLVIKHSQLNTDPSTWPTYSKQTRLSANQSVCCLSDFLCPDGVEAIGELFRVQDANLRARVALQALERWPLSACLELLEFCLNDPSTETSLRTDLELKKKELDIYHWVILRSSHTCRHHFKVC